MCTSQFMLLYVRTAPALRAGAIRMAPVYDCADSALEGTSLRWKLAFPPGRSHASRTPSYVGRLLAFCAPSEHPPGSVPGMRFRRLRSEGGRKPPSWQKIGCANVRPLSPLRQLQLHPLHSTRRVSPPRQAATSTASPRGLSSLCNYLRVPILRPPAGRVLPSEVCVFACKFSTECIYAILSDPKCINIQSAFCHFQSSGRAP